MSDLNVRSSTVEKGLDLAKEFLGKLIGPAVEEVGLLIADPIRSWRLNNQVKILSKAKKYADTHNLPLKAINLKVLVPLLDYAGLEETEPMQDKWANMIANMAGSEANLQNHVFPYLLSQISIEEFNELKKLLDKEGDYIETHFQLELIKKIEHTNDGTDADTLQKKLDIIEQNGFQLKIQPFAAENLVRLGLVHQLPPKIKPIKFIRGKKDSIPGLGFEIHTLNAEYDSFDYGYRLNKLGYLFLEICEQKNGISFPCFKDVEKGFDFEHRRSL
jgi:hypothetical protein